MGRMGLMAKGPATGWQIEVPHDGRESGWPALGKSGSKEGGLELGAAVGGVGEDQANAETKGVVGGLEGVA